MTVVKRNGQFYVFSLQDCNEDRLRPLRSKKEGSCSKEHERNEVLEGACDNGKDFS